MVDARNGKRFVDESFHYQNFGETTLEKGITRIWQISDAEAVGKYGLGMVKPKPFSPKPWVKQGYVKEAQTIAALEIGRASCRERVCQYVEISEVAVSFKKKKQTENNTHKS